jgi:hypothetical protein
MPKRSSKPKPPSDVNELAASIVAQATGEVPAEPEIVEAEPEKNPAAVALGRMGGLKGGAARAKKLSKKRLKEIAKKAATARWGEKQTRTPG